MPPGRKGSKRTQNPPEATQTEYETEYEKQRAVNMMRNNQMFQRLGLSQLKTLTTTLRAKSKDDGPQESGSLYDGEDSEGSEQDVSNNSQVTKGVRRHISDDVDEITAKRTTGSKRVMAPDLHEQPVRVTRQRNVAINKELAAATHPTPSDATNQDSTQGLIAAAQPSSPIQAEVDDHIGVEGIKAAKFASEGGIIVRQQMPIFPHWKYYKKKENEDKIEDYIGKLGAQFTMDVDSKAVKDACVDMLKGQQRQMRYRLKRKYFTGVPANQVISTSPVSSISDDQWKALVQKWSTPEDKKNSTQNKLNREKVLFPQCTGSQSYIAKAYVVKQEKYKDIEPSAIDLFKEMHCSKKKGFSETVKKAIVDMEAMTAAPVEDGQHAKSSTEVVSQALPGSSKFLHNVGLLSASKRSNTGTVSARMQELQSQLDTERQEKDGLREEVETLKAKSQASEATIANQSTEIADLKKSLAENSSLLRQILSISHGQVTPP